MQIYLIIWSYLALFIIANTETYTLRVPNFFDVPKIQQNPSITTQLTAVNSTHFIAPHYPIVNKYTYQTPLEPIKVNDIQDGDVKNMLIRLNNYNATTFDSNDLFFIKVCWPAIYPISFDISHLFLYSKSLGLSDTFDVYLDITLTADFKTYTSEYETIPEVQFKVIIEKLPNRYLPIPLEIYDTIMYLVNVTIILHQFLKIWPH